MNRALEPMSTACADKAQSSLRASVAATGSAKMPTCGHIARSRTLDRRRSTLPIARDPKRTYRPPLIILVEINRKQTRIAVIDKRITRRNPRTSSTRSSKTSQKDRVFKRQKLATRAVRTLDARLPSRRPLHPDTRQQKTTRPWKQALLPGASFGSSNAKRSVRFL